MASEMHKERQRLVALLSAAKDGKAEKLMELADEYAGKGPAELTPKVILREYKDGEGRSVAHFAANMGHVHVLERLKGVCSEILDEPDSSGSTPIHLAALGGRVAAMELLADEGADLHRARSDGTTALHMASRVGHDDVVEWLLERGADPLVEEAVGSALHVAAAAGEVGALEKVLVKLGDSAKEAANKRNSHGMTPLLMAAAGYHGGAVRLLLRFGSDPAAAGAHGLSAAHFLAESGDLESCRALLEAGGPEAMTLRNEDGYLPIQLAAGAEHAEIVNLLWDLSSSKLEGVDSKEALVTREKQRAAREQRERQARETRELEDKASSKVDHLLGPEPAKPTARKLEQANEHKERGNTFMKQGNPDKAERQYSMGLELDPTSAPLYANRSLLRLKRGALDEALIDARWARRLKPDWAKAHMRVAAVLEAKGHFEEAAFSLWDAIRLDESNPMLRERLKQVVDRARAEKKT